MAEERERSRLIGPHGHRTALVIVDCQNDFVSGRMSVPGSEAIIPVINSLREKVGYNLVVLVGDNHPKNHVSFLSTHLARHNVKLYDSLTINGQNQILYPTHCVMNSEGAAFVNGIGSESTDIIIYKGEHEEIDSYSAFTDRNKKYPTHLEHVLREHDITDVHVCGLGDYGHTALDAAGYLFETAVIEDACCTTPDKEAALKVKFERAKVAVLSAALVLENRSDRQKNAATYLEEHKIHQLFEYLCSQLVYEKPNDPRTYLIQQLQTMQQKKQSTTQLSTLSLFSETDFQTMFQMMDPIGKGVLSSSQVWKALHDLGIDGKKYKVDAKSDKTYTLELFKKLW